MFVCVLLVLVVLDAAAKCDTYVVGTTWIRRIGHQVDGEEAQSYQGCKKGCFYNGTYNEAGARICVACKEIKNEFNCTGNEATCHWTKGGKCTSQSCLNIAKLRGILTTTTSTFVDNNSVNRIGDYQDDVRREKECIEGSSREKYFNRVYFDDYKANVNKQYDPSCLVRCELNASLTMPSTSTKCDDRIYPNNNTDGCRLLPDIERQQCHWEVDNLRNESVCTDATCGARRNGTRLELCLQRRDLTYDPSCRLNGNVCEKDGDDNDVFPILSDDNRERIFGYRTIQNVCQHAKDLAHQACDDTYNYFVNTTCHNLVTGGGDLVTPVVRDRVATKASREACHYVYGCMYSKSHGRCSVWAVWAFILLLVLLVLVVGGVVVIAVAWVLKNK